MSSKVFQKAIGGLLLLAGILLISMQFLIPSETPEERVLLQKTEVVSTTIDFEIPPPEQVKPESNKFQQGNSVVKENKGQVAKQASPKETGIRLDTSVNFIRSIDKPEYESPLIPDRIVIPAIDLDAPVISADFNKTNLDGETFGQWKAPSAFAAGWHPDSALLGAVGNTVINGHHNLHGEVFKKLVELKIGDQIIIFSGDQAFSFVIANVMIVPERYADLETRMENARWLGKSNDMRLTLVTCWPENTNTHRLILVARPTERSRTY